MKTVLITGVAGYLSSYLVDILLNKGYLVIGIDNNWKNTCDTLIPYITHPNFGFIAGDITDKQFVKQLYDYIAYDYVVHTAGIVGAPACKKNKLLASMVNIEGTNHLIEHIQPQAKLVYCNTGSIYKGGGGVCNENSEVAPNSHYAKTKLVGEQVVLSVPNTISHRYATAMGLSRTNIRVNLLSNDLTYQAVTNKTLTLFEPEFMRTFIHCWDISNSIVFTMEHFDEMYAKQRVYNVGNNDLNFTKRQLAELIQQKTGCHLNYADTEKDPDQRDYGYSSDAIYSFGWRPQIGIDQTINELIKAVPLLSTFEKYK